MAKKMEAFGGWESPISAALLTQGARSISEVKVDAKSERDEVFWVEVRPSEGGRGVVCSHRAGETGVIDWTPEGFSARSRVHEYGGGAFGLGDGATFFTNAKDQGVYRQDSPGQAPRLLTPPDSKSRFCDYSCAHGRLFAVEEDHSVVKKEHDFPANNLVSFSCREPGPVTRIATGADFYACPRLSEDGKHLCWMQWSFPNMPWNGTEIWVADVSPSGEVSGSRKVCGDGGTSFVLPRLGAGGELFVSHDRSDWWNVYEVDVASGKERRNVYPVDAEIGEPHWQFGFSPFALEPAGARRMAFFLRKDLMLLQLGDGKAQRLETGYTTHAYVAFSAHNSVYAIAGAPGKPTAVLRCRLTDGEGTRVEVLREATDSCPDPGYISIPREVTFPTGSDKTAIAYAYYYPPANKDFQGPPDQLPPLVVMAHGGPTASARTSMELRKQFYTSRGFAVLDVNYRGSTGYGRKYRDALAGTFGLVDIEDCCSAAQFAAEQGWVDRAKLCIEGQSSGGYVVLCAILRPNLFSAAVSRYGISDLEGLQATTHKFEAPYNDYLLPPGPQAYKDRSPINHVDKIACPVAFFQARLSLSVPAPTQLPSSFRDSTTRSFHPIRPPTCTKPSSPKASPLLSSSLKVTYLRERHEGVESGR